MPVISLEEYEFLLSRLNDLHDVEFVHERTGYPFEMLLNILAKKITRNTLRNYYVVKKKSKILKQRWLLGESITFIAKKENFPPVLIASFIMSELGYSKRKIKEFIRNPELVEDKRLRLELEKAVQEDFVYSPASSEAQAKNGRRAEDFIAEWLDKNKVPYQTEVESREKGLSKTPDFLLKKKILIKGREVNWIESKSSFGDPYEVRRNSRLQLSYYVKMFGPGAVVYWYGYVEGLKPRGFILLTKEDLKQKDLIKKISLTRRQAHKPRRSKKAR